MKTDAWRNAHPSCISQAYLHLRAWMSTVLRFGDQKDASSPLSFLAFCHKSAQVSLFVKPTVAHHNCKEHQQLYHTSGFSPVAGSAATSPACTWPHHGNLLPPSVLAAPKHLSRKKQKLVPRLLRRTQRWRYQVDLPSLICQETSPTGENVKILVTLVTRRF